MREADQGSDEERDQEPPAPAGEGHEPECPAGRGVMGEG